MASEREICVSDYEKYLNMTAAKKISKEIRTAMKTNDEIIVNFHGVRYVDEECMYEILYDNVINSSINGNLGRVVVRGLGGVDYPRRIPDMIMNRLEYLHKNSIVTISDDDL